jgi:hypothetical protein
MVARLRFTFIILIALSLAGPATASAQSTRPPQEPPATTPAKQAANAKKDPNWSFEVFGGFGLGANPSGDGTTEFPAGATFTTEAGLPSRAIPSWYFGDGAVLFNQVRAQFASLFNVNVPQIVTLDPLFADGGLERQGGAAFGVRLTRKLTPRYSLEFGLQRHQGKLTVSDSARGAIEASRASFDQALRGLLGTIPQAGLQVSSSADLPDTTTAPQTAITAVLNIALAQKRLAPYLSVGVGWVTNSAETMTVRLRGSYQFRFFDTNPFNETDNVTIRTTDGDSSIIGVFGGGALYELSARQGLRFDVRIHAGTTGIASELDAGPTVVTGSPTLALPSITNPSVQFSNTPSLTTSLSGRMSGQTVFTGSGLDTRVNLTVGYFIRF